jgi:dipeptidyl aminopeptidase/acylaminoacyl peptidase
VSNAIDMILPLAAALAVATAAATPPVYRAQILPRWSADNTRFWYRNDGADGTREFVVVDAVRGVREPAFDHARAATAIRQLTGKEVSAGKLPVSHLTFAGTAGVVLRGGEGAWFLDLQTYVARPVTADDEDGEIRLPVGSRPHPSGQGGEETWITFDNRLEVAVDLFWIDGQGERRSYGKVQAGQRREQHTYARHVWLVTAAETDAVRTFEAEAQPALAVIALPAPVPEPATPPATPADGRPWGQLSPDGKMQIFLRDSNLWLYERAGGTEAALSADGTPEATYSVDACWWSPDSCRLAAWRTELAPVRRVTLIESRPQDQVEPKLHAFDYPKPGDRIARPQPRLFDVSRRTAVAIPGDLCPNPWSLQDVRWAADSSRFSFVYNQRGHQVLQVIAVDAVSGQPRVLVDERSSTFICYSSKYFCEWLGDDELVWMSERDGWNHLWLYDAQTGAVRNQITRGAWVVQGVESVDRAARQIVFRAGGVEAGQDPYSTHFCRIGLDGSGRVTLTPGDGTHSVTWSPDGRFFIDTTSRVDLPPIHELRRGDTGALVCPLEQADAAAALAAAGRWPERFVAKGRDGQTDIHGIILRPRDFNPQRRYPVIEDIYAGPQASYVPKAFSARHGQQALADRGFIIVRIDGMGTSGRSKAFHDVCWQNLRDAGLPDRIAWIRAAAAEHPEMDLTRVGIYGGSAGGQNALAALLWHGDFYKVAVADCGCHDNRMDKMWWNEQWLGWPVGPQYEASSNVVHAPQLQGRLLLIVGELDRNVDPASTLQVADTLVKADKDFELLVLPGVGHGAAETPYGMRRRSEFLVRHLLSKAE